MPQLVFRAAALRDLAKIADYIEGESASEEGATAFNDKLIAHCEGLASRATLMGRARADLRLGIRSAIFGNYVIFFRYGDDDGPRSHLYISNIIHGRRDIDAYFADLTDDEDD